MRLLLDTNVIIWLLANDPRMTEKVCQTLDAAEEVHFSAASIWEIAIKAGLGKLGVNAGAVVRSLEGSFIRPMSIEPAHTVPVQTLPAVHSDPFDRLLLAQATVEGLTLLTGDKLLKRYDHTGRVVRHLSDL